MCRVINAVQINHPIGYPIAMKYIESVSRETMNKYICLSTTNDINIIIMGVRESPTPRSAPASIWLVALTGSNMLLSRMNSTANPNTAASWLNSPAMYGAKIYSIVMITAERLQDRHNPVNKPLLILSGLRAPAFCPTKVVTDIPIL